MQTTGWPPGMLQDDSRDLSRWLSTRPGARYQLQRNNMQTNQTPEALAEEAHAAVRALYDLAAHKDEYGDAEYRNLNKLASERVVSGINRLRDMAVSGAKECAALQRDAERYRWLRDKATGEIVFDHTEDQSDGGHHFALYVPFDGREIPDDEASGQTLDEAIDAAIAATKRGGA